MGFLDDLKGDFGFLGGFKVTLEQMAKPRITWQYPAEKKPKPIRQHGRHVLNRYEDGMEKCIGCELCAGVCPADCIYVRGADNDPEQPTSPGERFGFVYEINYLRCIHCDMCVEACPTEAITETKLFEFSFTNRADAIYTKEELLVDDAGHPKHLPWEDWREGDDLHTSAWMRATSPGGNAAYEGTVQWSGELGYGVRAPEGGQSGNRDDAATGIRSLRDIYALHLDDSERPPDQRGAEGVKNRMKAKVDAKRAHDEETDFPEVIAAVSSVDAFVFTVAALMVLGGAVGVVLMRNPVHSALMLVLTLFGIAVLFVEQEADFLAAVQVMVYAGAIVVLFLFVIMFLGVDRQENLDEDPLPGQRPFAVVLVVLGLAGLLFLAAGAHWAVGASSVAGPAERQNGGDVAALGRAVFTTYLFPFEITAALLVIAVVGAVVLARRPPRVAPAPDDAVASVTPIMGEPIGDPMVAVAEAVAKAVAAGRVVVPPEPEAADAPDAAPAGAAAGAAAEAEAESQEVSG